MTPYLFDAEDKVTATFEPAVPTEALFNAELTSVANTLTDKFPTLTADLIRQVVTDVHRDLVDRARLSGHLIPLTLNLSRRRLQLIVSGDAAIET